MKCSDLGESVARASNTFSQTSAFTQQFKQL